MKKMGKIYGVGVGPGAVDLLSVRADKLVREAKYIAFFRKAGRAGHARQIASTLLSKDVIELAMEYPITTEIPLSDQRYSEVLSEFYKKYSNKIISLSQTGTDLVYYVKEIHFFMVLSCIFTAVLKINVQLKLCSLLLVCQLLGLQLTFP